MVLLHIKILNSEGIDLFRESLIVLLDFSQLLFQRIFFNTVLKSAFLHLAILALGLFDGVGELSDLFSMGVIVFKVDDRYFELLNSRVTTRDISNKCFILLLKVSIVILKTSNLAL